MPTITTSRRHRDLLQGLGLGPADRVQPRLAAVGRRLGHPDAVLPAAGYRVIAHDRRGHGRSTPDQRRSRHGPLRRRPRGADGPSRSPGRRPRRALDRRRRGRALHRPTRREPRGEGGADQRGAAAHGADRRQPRRPAEERVRRPPGPAGRQPVRVLPGPAVRPVLRLQPARRGALGGDHRELVAPGDDGRREGALRRHRRVLPDRLHRGPQEDHRAGPGDARRRRPDRSLRRLRRRCRPSSCRTGR